jgi:hypothetical protein
MLIFVVITISEKDDLNKIDWMLLVTFTLCLLFAFFIIFDQSELSAYLLLFCSCVSYSPSLYLPFYRDPISSAPSAYDSITSQMATRRFQLSVFLTITFVLYVITYFFAHFGRIDYPMTIIIFQILSIVTKGLFATIVLDIQIFGIRSIQTLLDEKANAARRAFMKYVSKIGIHR